MKATEIAWVTGYKLAGYRLNVSASRAPKFVVLDYTLFNTLYAAQTIANAIRAAVIKESKKP